MSKEEIIIIVIVVILVIFVIWVIYRKHEHEKVFEFMSNHPGSRFDSRIYDSRDNQRYPGGNNQLLKDVGNQTGFVNSFC